MNSTSIACFPQGPKEMWVLMDACALDELSFNPTKWVGMTILNFYNITQLN
jgi:hypothetical protein